MHGETTTLDWSSDDRAMVSDAAASCVTGSTAIDAVRLALGSTLGAFIALAVVVAFVLLAKCQHRRRVRRVRRRHRRRRRRSSDKSPPLTDSDNVSFFDYYDDEYGSVLKGDVAAAAATELSRGFPPPPRYDTSRLIFTNEFVVPDACREWNVDDDMNDEFYDVASVAAADRQPAGMSDGQNAAGIFAESAAFDSGVTCSANFVPEIMDDGSCEHPVVSQSFRTALGAPSTPRCDETSKATVERKSDVLKPTRGDTQTDAADTVDVISSDSRDTTGLLGALGDGRTPGALKPNHYSSIW